ncbi:hypothetical protein SPBR_06404 [Sporothrix brasiliensis 5110]|uniref:Integral membrane bound transporter domain-containing protein n=1 Tax=Sporothrix brasiliensis 5110 TaxID=1398154 RepID=A0A0C2FED9_9PEZI|nr:uncharacterized protein SPBR_06404 [Sporothrix brasiliensis 5110]KIH89513.1 hypothetical protein SPBR_06404 [Sporothrix brasiliensis 5110]
MGDNVTNTGGPAANGQWPPPRGARRSKLRNGTFIIPSTGERSRRQFTLRNGIASSSSPRPGNMSSPGSLLGDDENDLSFFSAPGFIARFEAAGRAARDGLGRFRSWMDSPKGRGVIKCTVAYTIASLWTFWPPLSDLLGRLDGKHLVATITVYFHPARTAGSMIEATAIGVVAVAYAEIISILSMATSVLFGSVLGWVTFAYLVVLVFFICVAFGFIGWVKQRLNNPSVNVGCTLASLAIITVVTKENATYSSVFSNDKVAQVLKTLVFGISTTAAVSLLLWRVSARALLRESFTEASKSLGDMLAMITHGFLSGAEDELTVSAEYRTAVSNWTTAHAQMTKNLKEAKYEHFAVGHASLYQFEKLVYKSMETLALSIGGLRSAANTQFELMRESAAATAAAAAGASTAGSTTATPGTGIPTGSAAPAMSLDQLLGSPLSATFSPSSSPSLALGAAASSSSGPSAASSASSSARPQLYRASSSFQRSGRLAVLSAIDEASDESSEDRPDAPLITQYSDNDTGGLMNTPLSSRPVADHMPLIDIGDRAPSVRSGKSRRDSTATLRTSSEIFELFIGMLGPSVKSLAFTLATVLRDSPFGGPPRFEIFINDHYRQSLTDALALFNTARADALEELYKTIELGRPRSEKIKADYEEVAAACGHFSFSLQAFGEEMTKYLDVLDDLKLIHDHNRRSWRWLLFWKAPQLRYPSVLPFEAAVPDRVGDTDGTYDSLANNTAASNGNARGVASGSNSNNNNSSNGVRPIRKSQLPRGIPDEMIKQRDTFSWQAAPQSNKVVRQMAQNVLRFFRVLTRDDIRFGIKVGIGAMLWASMAFIPQTRDMYVHWRGEWGLLSFMIVCSMTVGASNTTGLARFLATLAGSACAVINWNISRGYALPLLILGGVVAFSSFFVMIDRGKAPLGRTTLLAYNVISLYAYSLSQRVDDDDDDEGGIHPFIMDIAKHRFLAVTAGILWGLVVCRVVWPISARRRFKEGVSVLYLQMGLIWKRGPLAMLLRSDCTRSYLKSGEQAALQRYAGRLETLRQGAASEFELRGPFPFAAAGRMMAATNRALDGFYAMSLVTQRRGRLTEGERALLYYTAAERAMLCDRVCHVFQVLASSFMLEYPLTDALPGVAIVRDRLLAKIFQFRKEHAAAVKQQQQQEQFNSLLEEDEDGCDNENDNDKDNNNEEADIAQHGSRRGSGIAGAAAAPPPPDAAAIVNVEERDYALLYAYALVTGQVAEELRNIEKEIEGLFGVLDEESTLLQ